MPDNSPSKERPSVSDLPPFDPQGTETIQAIPERFLVGGLLRLDGRGLWWFRGERIEHPGVCRFLLTQIRRNHEGAYWVVNGPQRVLVEVEETAFFVQEVVEKDGSLCLRLNDGTEEELEFSSLRWESSDRLIAEVKRGKAGAREGESHGAKWSREAVLQIADLLVETSEGIALKWQDKLHFFAGREVD